MNYHFTPKIKLICGISHQADILECVFLQSVIRQKVKRQLTKHQKAAQRRRLQKGEANLVTKERRENLSNIKSSLEAAQFWG